MFSVVYWNQPVCLWVCVSVCVQDTSFCQSPGRDIKSHLVTALVVFDMVENIVWKGENADYQYFLLFSQCFPKM